MEVTLSPADFDTFGELDARAGREEVGKLVLFAAVRDVAETDDYKDCDGSKAANTPRIWRQHCLRGVYLASGRIHWALAAGKVQARKIDAIGRRLKQVLGSNILNSVEGETLHSLAKG